MQQRDRCGSTDTHVHANTHNSVRLKVNKRIGLHCGTNTLSDTDTTVHSLCNYLIASVLLRFIRLQVFTLPMDGNPTCITADLYL